MPRDLFADLPEYSNQRQPHDLLQGMKVDNSEEQRYPGMLDRLPLQGLIPQATRDFVNKLPTNILAGGLKFGEDLINAPQSGWNLVAPSIGKHVPHIQEHDFSKMLGLPGTKSDKIVQFLAEQAPNFIGGGGAARALAKEVPAAIKDVPYNLSKKLLGEGEAEAEQLRLPEPPPEAPQIGSSDKVKQDLINSITEGRSLKQTHKEAARQLNRSYENQRNITRKNFNEFLESPNEGGSSLEPTIQQLELLPASKGHLGLVRQGQSYIFPKSIIDDFSKEAKELYHKFDNKSILGNGHFLQSQLGKDIRREMNKADTNWDKVTSNIKARDKINNLIDERLKGTPHAETYNRIKKYHKENVEPYRIGPIAEIAEGNIKNPGNLASIFKNQEPHIEAILGHLPNNFKSKIIHSALGDIGAGMKPQKISALETELGNKRVSDYLLPEQKKNIRSFDKEYSNEQKQLQEFKQKIENYEGRNKELHNTHKQDIKEKELARQKESNNKRELTRALGTIGAGGLGLLAGSPTLAGAAASAAYMSKPILEKLARAIIKSREKKGI